MAFTSQPNFIGVLDGTDVNNLNNKIDYTKSKLEERKTVVNNILNSTNFYEEYFEDHFKSSINANDHLSSEINICKSLERMANYLLNSKEIKQEEDNEKTKYVFHTDEKYFQKKVGREQSIEQMAKTDSGDHENNVIHFLKRDDENYKKEKIQTISFNDIKPDNTNTIEDVNNVVSLLNDYKNFYDRVTEKLINKDEDINRYLLTKVKGQLTEDMIYSKDHLLGVFGYDLKNGQKEDSKPSLDIFDFTNWNHVYGKEITFVGKNRRGKELEHTVVAKGLMFFTPTNDLNNDFNLTLIDFAETVKKANLTEEEQEILELSKSGLTLQEIALEFDTYHMKISRVLQRIAKKIISVGNKYDLSNQAA